VEGRYPVTIGDFEKIRHSGEALYNSRRLVKLESSFRKTMKNEELDPSFRWDDEQKQVFRCPQSRLKPLLRESAL